MRVIVTRPAAQAVSWVQSLQREGIAAVALPLIDIAPALDPTPVIEAWQHLAGTRLVMFVSANAVEHFFALRPVGTSWPADTQAASPGPGTTRALATHPRIARRAEHAGFAPVWQCAPTLDEVVACIQSAAP